MVVLRTDTAVTRRGTTPRKPPPVQLPRLAAVLVAPAARCGPRRSHGSLLWSLFRWTRVARPSTFASLRSAHRRRGSPNRRPLSLPPHRGSPRSPLPPSACSRVVPPRSHRGAPRSRFPAVTARPRGLPAVGHAGRASRRSAPTVPGVRLAAVAPLRPLTVPGGSPGAWLVGRVRGRAPLAPVWRRAKARARARSDDGVALVERDGVGWEAESRGWRVVESEKAPSERLHGMHLDQ